MASYTSVITDPADNYLFLIGSHTAEKAEQYSAIARHQDVNAVVVSLKNHVGLFASAPELTGDVVANTHEKTDRIAPIVRALNNPSSEESRAIQTKCHRDWRIHYNPNKQFVLTEDHTYCLESHVWQPLRAKLLARGVVSESTLARADSYNAEGWGGPGSETGDIVNGQNCRAFFELLAETIRESNLTEPVKLRERCVLDASSVGSLTAPLIEVITESEVFLDLNENGLIPEDNWQEFFHHSYIARRSGATSGTGKLIGKNLIDYHAHRGCRALAFKQLMQRIEALPNSANAASIHRLPAKPIGKGKPTIIQPNSGVIPRGIPGLRRQLAIPRIKATTISEALALNKQLRICSNELCRSPDAMIFVPFDNSNFFERRANSLLFFSTLVAGEIEPDGAHPIVVINDGSWDCILGLDRDIVNGGFSKNFVRTDFYDPNRIVTVKGIQHLATGAYDVVTGRGASRQDLELAAKQVLDYRLARYSRFSTRLPVTRFESSGIPRNPSDYVFFNFTSASSENHNLGELNHELCKYGAEKGGAMGWGAGDRHAMGRSLSGAMAGGAHWIGGYSTPNLIMVETDHGRFPAACTYYESHIDIYGRMAAMFSHGDDFFITAGGHGTVQEAVAGHWLLEAKPELMVGKRLIYVDVDIHETGRPSVIQQTLSTFLSNEDFNYIYKNHRCLESKGIQLATSLEEAKHYMREGIHRKKMQQTQHQLAA